MNITSLAKLTTVIAALSFATESYAVPQSIDNLTFSEASPGVTLTGISGSGTLADPYVLLETVTSQDVTIEIRGMQSAVNPSGSGHSAGFRLRKVITNNTGGSWTLYDNELQQVLGTPSSDGDGLSFGQGSGQTPVGNPISTVIEIDTIRDYVNFSGGSVAPGGVLTVEYTISDNSPNLFYLRQRPNVDFTGKRVPEAGSTLALGGLALGALSMLRRKRA